MGYLDMESNCEYHAWFGQNRAIYFDFNNSVEWKIFQSTLLAGQNPSTLLNFLKICPSTLLFPTHDYSRNQSKEHDMAYAGPRRDSLVYCLLVV